MWSRPGVPCVSAVPGFQNVQTKIQHGINLKLDRRRLVGGVSRTLKMPDASGKAVCSGDVNRAENKPSGLHMVPHLEDYLGPLERVRNPLLQNPFFSCSNTFFMTDYDVVARKVVHDTRVTTPEAFFLGVGPRENVVFVAEEVKAAIVTCGGLCPGINTVVREIVNALWNAYGVRSVRGIKAGYRGFYSSEPMHLDPTIVDDWHKKGGSILGTSRGGFDLKRIVDGIEAKGFNQLYVIGGDGTMRGAVAIFQELQRRKVKASILGIPKTVDNDIAIIDKSFGLETAVERAQAAIDAAHVEANSTPNGIGVVKLMGRNAGHIAVRATLSSRDVDCVLIPEVPFYLEGEGGLFEFLGHRLADKGHCVIVVAEGAGQELIPRTEEENTRDDSGNLQLLDIGRFVVSEIKRWWRQTHPDELFAVKYIDPTYMVRAVPSNAGDTLYCTLLAHSVVHGSMAGYTGCIAGPVNSAYSYIPMSDIADVSNRVDVTSHVWGWVRSTNDQPDFLKKEPAKSSDDVAKDRSASTDIPTKVAA